jgi:hypothetical protein
MPAWELADDGELAEVLVEGDEGPALRERTGHDLLVAWVDRPVAGPDHVVASGPEPLDGTTPHAGVEKELHVPVGTRRGSTRSWATSRFA